MFSVCETESLWIENYVQLPTTPMANQILYGKGNKTARCQVDLFVKLIMCDYHVRELAQREETLREKKKRVAHS